MSDSLFIVLHLAIALAVTAWAIHFKRDRRILFAVMGVSLLILGVIKSGCTCSPGSVQNIALAFIDKDYTLSLAILGIFFLPIIASFFWGRVFCSGVCPLGIVQDLLSVIRINIPRWLRGVLGFVPLVYLAYIVIAIVAGLGFVLCKYDPYVHLLRFNITPGFLWFTIISAIITMVIYRPFCSFFCPYGLILGWVGKFSQNKIQPTRMKCATCNLCADACPVDAIEYGDKKIEEQKFSIGRIGWLLIALIPLWFFLFGSVGSMTAGSVAVVKTRKGPVKISEQASKIQEKIKTQEELIAKKENAGKKTVKLKTRLEETKQEVVRLESKLASIKSKSFYVGAALGLYWGVLLLFLYERKKKKGITVDMAKCVTCGRCNNYCPSESKEVHAGIKNFLLGHIKHRKEAHPKLKLAMIIGAALTFTTLVGSLVTLQSGMQEQEKIEVSRKEYIKMYNSLRKKKSATPELKAKYVSEQEEYQTRLVKSEQKRKISMMVLVVSLFVFVALSKYLIGKKEYSLVLKDLKKYRSKIHGLNELLIFGGVVILGLLIFILAQLLL